MINQKPMINTDTFTDIKSYIKQPYLNIKDSLTPNVIAVNQNEVRMFDRAVEAAEKDEDIKKRLDPE